MSCMTALSGAVGPTQPLSGAESGPVPPAVPLLAPQRMQTHAKRACACAPRCGARTGLAGAQTACKLLTAPAPCCRQGKHQG